MLYKHLYSETMFFFSSFKQFITSRAVQDIFSNFDQRSVDASVGRIMMSIKSLMAFASKTLADDNCQGKEISPDLDVSE